MLIKKDSIEKEVKTNKASKSIPSSKSTPTTPNTNSIQTKSPSDAHPQPTKTQAYSSTPSKSLNPSTLNKNNASKAKITINYDVGFSNTLTIRGKGANLSWDKGQPLKNIKPDELVWECDLPFTQCEFKVLINDSQYENGENHILTSQSSIRYTPKF